jgi:hypothetical protein
MEALMRLLKVKPESIIRRPPAGQEATGVQADLVVILGEDYDPCD